jgi:hypothetical protein
MASACSTAKPAKALAAIARAFFYFGRPAHHFKNRPTQAKKFFMI